MTFKPSFQNWPWNGTLKKTPHTCQINFYPRVAKCFGGDAEIAIMNGKQKFGTEQTDMDVQFVQERIESEPPKPEMNPRK